MMRCGLRFFFFSFCHLFLATRCAISFLAIRVLACIIYRGAVERFMFDQPFKFVIFVVLYVKL